MTDPNKKKGPEEEKNAIVKYVEDVKKDKSLQLSEGLWVGGGAVAGALVFGPLGLVFCAAAATRPGRQALSFAAAKLMEDFNGSSGTGNKPGSPKKKPPKGPRR
jgi:hypothetical protein